MSTEFEREDDVEVIDREKEDHKTEEPPKYKVVMLNDDYTPMEFVVDILKGYFSNTTEQATHTMMEIHQKGKGVAGIYTRDIAETKSTAVNNIAQSQGHPFLTEIEPE